MRRRNFPDPPPGDSHDKFHFLDNQGKMREDGFVLRSEMERVFSYVDEDMRTLIQDMQLQSAELNQLKYILNTQAYVLDAVSKIIVNAGLASQEQFQEIMAKTFAELQKVNQANESEPKKS